MGATYVVDSSSPTFRADLIAALEATGATLAFDAIGGGRVGGQILSCMEAVASSKLGAYNRYGSDVYKQLYIYGMLDTSPTEIVRNFGFSWGVSGWLLTPALGKIGLSEAGPDHNVDAVVAHPDRRYGLVAVRELVRLQLPGQRERRPLSPGRSGDARERSRHGK